MSFLLDQYFDDVTMSVHFKAGVPVFAKKGMPGDWRLETISKKNFTMKDAEKMIETLLNEIAESGSFVEIDKRFSKVLQLGPYRIVIVLPPLSDTHEITVARPLRKLNLADYHLAPALQERLKHHSEGILIAGRPGQGKSTFAQALIELYALENKIIKTIEAPRDLQVPDNVTQYSLFHSTLEEIHDILLLSRPDYTFFDEVRNRDDFELFKDLRLTGIGMVGVIHGAKPIDAIQRFVGKIELGMIPEIVDTLVFIESGQVQKVYDLKLQVKVPHGMFEQDLARPVVVISDFGTGYSEYEIYTFGSETVVLPIANAGGGDLFQKKSRAYTRNRSPLHSDKKQALGKEVFPRFIKDKKGFRFVFEEAVYQAMILFENGEVFSISPNKNGYVKIGKKGRLPEMLRKKQFQVFLEK